MKKKRSPENLNEAIKHLEEREVQKYNEKYYGDGNEIAFRRHLLILLKDIGEKLDNLKTRSKKKSKRKPSDWQIFFGEQIKKGKSIQEISQMWRLKK